MGYENLAQYLRGDCLETSGVPPSRENYGSNDVVMEVGQSIEVAIIKEEYISLSHPLPSFSSDAPPKIIVKFTRRDIYKERFLRKL